MPELGSSRGSISISSKKIKKNHRTVLYYTCISLNRNHSAISVTTVIGEERGEWDSIDIRFLNAK